MIVIEANAVLCTGRYCSRPFRPLCSVLSEDIVQTFCCIDSTPWRQSVHRYGGLQGRWTYSSKPLNSHTAKGVPPTKREYMIKWQHFKSSCTWLQNGASHKPIGEVHTAVTLVSHLMAVTVSLHCGWCNRITLSTKWCRDKTFSHGGLKRAFTTDMSL